jgi:glycosyltransferase involved in cell wall biosynthesis
VADPSVTVVIPSHGRPLRLLWLLNALEEQTLPGRDWEAIVVHDYDSQTAERVLDRHPLAAAGRLRNVAIEPGTGSPARQRNIGWHRARGPLVAFIDDDCRPDRRWLESLLTRSGGRACSFVQGTTRPDPYERDVFAAPHVRTLKIIPPNRSVQTCNVLYPRALLEELGGLDESPLLRIGEDLDLAVRARRAGAEHLVAPDALVFHAVEALTLPVAIREDFKWRHLALLVRRYPELRRTCTLRLFWDQEHLLVVLAAVGLVAARRRRLAPLLVLPWVLYEGRRRGHRPKDLAVNAMELPGRTLRELGKVLTFAAGSARHRTLVL